MLTKLKDAARDGHLLTSVREGVDWRLGRPMRQRLMRRWGHPTVTDMLVEGGGEVLLDPRLFAEAIAGPDAGTYSAEFEEVAAALSASRGASENYDEVFDVESGTARALYGHIRAHHPAHVLETGVANGVSSYFILAAMLRNGEGTLHSVDVSPDVGRLVTTEQRSRWDLHVLHPGDRAGHFKRIAAGLPQIDLFMHDSEHSYAWMRMEYEAAEKRLRPGGWLTSDDCDCSYAFSEFCAARTLTPTYLFDGRKLFGAVQLPA